MLTLGAFASLALCERHVTQTQQAESSMRRPLYLLPLVISAFVFGHLFGREGVAVARADCDLPHLVLRLSSINGEGTAGPETAIFLEDATLSNEFLGFSEGDDYHALVLEPR